MEVGVAVWLRDAVGDKAWIATSILSKENVEGKVVVRVKNEFTGEDHIFKLDDENQEIDDLKLRNDDSESQVENLINLPYLHEPAILYSLESRYYKSNIYTYTGPILIAVNPFKHVPLYSTQILESYYNLGLLKSQGIDSSNSAPLSPHVYAIADAAYRDMMKIIKDAGGGAVGSKVPANQCVLISGESGAGKTESTKIVLKYLTTVGSSTGSVQQDTGSVMDKILQSNPILEAFGNARTLRNDNSSRFGKFIELNFNKRGVLIGGRIRTYLLEKVRLPCQQLGERNFHVFYQMAAGASEEERAEWRLMPLQETWYTSQGDIYELRHVNDGDEFRKMKLALKTLNFPQEHQSSLFRVMAGLLHLGQLQFQSDKSGEGSIVSSESEVQRSLELVSELLCVSKEELESSLTKRVITARMETVVKNLNPVQASDTRDSLARAIYGKIFDWIVRTINTSIEVDMAGVRADIGVLDIFGFECFKNNSFEQLCINYTNETLQQQFNQFVFKLEQKEYEAEKIEWSFISFPDNQDCLDLIEHKQKGLLAMLDDECRLPGASDEKFASRLYKSYEGNNRFSATPAQKRDSMFCIRHYAGIVVYCSRTFVEKNKDELPKEAENLMIQAGVSLLGLVFAATPALAPAVAAAGTSAAGGTKGKAGGEREKTLSVGTQFKEQLASLMEKIYSTAPHYIRCLKPNDENAPDNFNRRRTTEQLRYGGVLEAVRVARSGFPVRLSHSDYFLRYRCLANPFNAVTARLPRYIHNRQSEARELCEMLLDTLWDESVPSLDQNDHIPLGRNRRVSRIMDVNAWKGKLQIPRESLQLGLNKVFLRKAAHDLLEARRSRRLNNSAIRIQAIVRSFRLRSRFMTLIWAVRTIQRVGRGSIARVSATKLKFQKCAKIVQTSFRRYIIRKKYIRYIKAVVLLQNLQRSKFAKAALNELKYFARVHRIQRVCRRLVAFHKYQRLRRAIIALQCRHRRFVAMAELKQLKSAAKDLGLLKQNNDALKAEIEQLKARAAEDARKMLEKASAAKDAEYHRVLLELSELKENFQTEYKLRLLLETKLTTSEASLAAAKAKLIAADENAVNLNNIVSGLKQEIARVQLEASETEYQLQESVVALRQSQLEASDLTGRLAELEEELYRVSLEAASRAKHDGSANQLPPAPAAPAPAPAPSLASLAFPSVTPTIAPITVPTSYVSSEENEELLKERRRRETLEDEVSRLRHMTMDLRSQLDTARRPASTGPSAGVGAPLARRPDAEPKRKTSLTRGSFGSEGSTSTAPAAKPPLPTMRKPNSKPLAVPHPKNSADLAQVAAVAELNNFDDDDLDEDDSASQASNPHMVSRSLSTTSSSNTSSNVSHVRPVSISNKRGSSNSNDGGGATIGQQAAAVASTHAAMDVFEKNLEAFKTKLKQGLKAFVWDGARVTRAEVTIKLSANGDSLVFESKKAFFFSSRVDVPPVNIADIYECIPAAEVNETIDSSLLMTIVVKLASGNDSRIMAVELPNKEERNTMLTGVRSLVSQKSLKSFGTQSQGAGASSSAMRAAPSIASGSSRLLGQPSASNSSSGSSNTIASTAAAAAVAAIRKPLRKQSVRDVALEAALSAVSTSASTSAEPGSVAAGASSPNTVSGLNPMAAQRLRGKPAPHAISDLTHSQDGLTIEDCVRQLQTEREEHERMMVQMMMLTNDLNDRDEQIAVLRQRESALQATYAQKEAMWEQDALVRMQLGKKLEAVLMDKEELEEECELLHEQLDSVRASYALVVEQNAATAAMSSR